MSPSRAGRASNAASRVSRSSNKKPVTIRINSDEYDPQQYYEGGYGEEMDESEDDPEF